MKRCFSASCRTTLAAFFFLVALLQTQPATAIIITEIMYNPPADLEAANGDANLEWVEIYNDEPTVVHLTGYYFSEGVNFTFPFDTYLEGRSYLVIAADAEAVRAAYDIDNVIGNFGGQLDNDGERLTINIYGGGPDISLNFSDRGQWPRIADGTGHSLMIKDVYGPQSDNDNWTSSIVVGGTPGRANFDEPRVVETVIIPEDSTWRYRKNTTEYPNGWQAVEFDDSGWLEGPTGIGYGDDDDVTILDDMRNNYTSFANRKSLELTQEQIDSFDDVSFQIRYDDGFVLFLNGQEVSRNRIGNPGDPLSFEQRAQSHEAREFEAFSISTDRLRVGTNTFAVAIHNATENSSDVSFQPKLISSRIELPNPAGEPVPVVFNECFVRTGEEGWLELHNTAGRPIDLSGFFLSDDNNALNKWAIPEGTTIAANGYLVFTDSQVTLDLSTEQVSVFLTRPNRQQVLDAAHFENPAEATPALNGTSDARYPDGAGRFMAAATPTPGAQNQVALEEDIVINEIMYHPPLDPQLARQESRPGVSFVELYNRSDRDIDLSGFRFNRGIGYTFEAGTTLGAGEYLAVAEDPELLRAAHTADLPIVGPYSGDLSSKGELIRLVDTRGNIADEVRYYDGGHWPKWADGGGSSLELLDPHQDNSVPSAWADSDESTKSPWEEISYNLNYSTQSESEFQIRMLAAAEVLVDDIQVRRNNTQYIRNGSFESNTSSWIIQGNHIQSVRTTEDSTAGNASLKIIATGDGDTRVNRVETETSPRMTSGTHQVSLQARWLRGGNLIFFSCYSQHAQCQRPHWLQIPLNLGSPGMVNSMAENNLGPVVSEVVHRPAVPASGQEVTILARVTDSDGVGSVHAHYDPAGNNPAGEAELFDDGGHQDGAAGDGLYGGTVPGFANNIKVTFYVEAVDVLGAVRREPRNAPSKTNVYQHSTPLTANSFTYRLIHDDANWSRLGSRQLHSNELLDATFIFNEEKVFYNVGTRWRGSPWNRPGNPRMYRVTFPKDQPLRNRTKINLSRYGSTQREKAAGYCVWRNSTPSTTSPYNRSVWARVRTNAGTYIMESIEPTNSEYLDLWFPQDSNGILMKITGKQTFNDSGSHQSNLLRWANWSNRGGAKTSYRWNFNFRTRELEDNFSPLISLIQTMNGSSTVLDNQLEDIMDVEQFLRVYAARCAHDDWDTIAIGNGQNAYIYYASNEGRWKLLPWDMDHSWGNTGARVYPDNDATFRRIVERPKYRRKYMGILNEMVNGLGGNPGYWSVGEMVTKYLDRNTAVVGSDGVGNSSPVRNFVNSRRNTLSRQVPNRVNFAITTNSGNDFTVDDDTTRITGSGWVDVDMLLVSGEPMELNWTTTTRWQTDVPLSAGENQLDFLALDVEGNVVGNDSVTVTSTFGWQPPAITSISPASAQPGDRITITGTEFHVGIRVLIDGQEAGGVEFDEASPQSLGAIVPWHRPGVVEVTVRNTDGRSAPPADFTILPPPPQFIRGDANTDEQLDVSDAVKVVRYLFSGATITCLDAGDANDDEVINITDAVYVLEHLYRGAAAPPAPYPLRGGDPEGGAALGCEEGLDPFPGGLGR